MYKYFLFLFFLIEIDSDCINDCESVTVYFFVNNQEIDRITLICIRYEENFDSIS